MQYDLRPDRLANAKPEWDGLVEKYLNSSKQGQHILKRQLGGMIISFEEDPDALMINVYQLRDELANMGDRTVCAKRIAENFLERL